MPKQKPSVIVAIPYFGERVSVRRAIESVLNQTSSVDAVVVVNDSHPDEPRAALAAIDDPRVVYMDLALGRSRGPFFAKEVVRRALPRKAVMGTLDADDVWHPRFAEMCLRHIAAGAAAAIPSECRTGLGGESISRYWDVDGNEHVAEYQSLPRHQGIAIAPVGSPRITAESQFRVRVQGLFRQDALKAVGGFYGGERFGYDRPLGNLLLMMGGLVRMPEVLYLRHLHEDSLTTSAVTGTDSPARLACNARCQALHSDVFRDYLRLRPDQNPKARPEFSRTVRSVISARVSPEREVELAAKSALLTDSLMRAIERAPGLELGHVADRVG